MYAFALTYQSPLAMSVLLTLALQALHLHSHGVPAAVIGVTEHAIL